MRYFGVWIISALLFGLFTPTVVAQAPSEMPNLSIRCLDATNISQTKSQHFVTLKGGGFTPNQPVEIWRDSEEGFVCAVDRSGVSLCGNATLNAKDNGKEFQLMEMTKDQVVANGSGEINISKTRSRTAKRLTHNFYGAQKTAPTLSGGTLPDLTVDDYGLKLLTFLEEQQAATPSGANNCATVFFDPYGRVFDSISLEPISNVTVQLLDSDRNSVPNQPGVVNPNITLSDGAFSFFVPDGTYYLNPKASAYTFPLSDLEINSLATSQSIYYELYKGDPIVQQGEIQHRDIPLKPIDPNNPTNTQPVILAKSIIPFEENGISYQQISGIVSHPNSVVNVYSGTRVIGTVETNEKGEFEITVENSQIDQTLPLEIIAQKVALTNQAVQTKILPSLDWLIHSVSAEVNSQSQPVSLSPRPNFLIGYLYNREGKAIPLSTVEIVLNRMNNQVYSTLKADANGFIFVPQQSLPPLEYRLRIKDPAGTVANEQTTTDFIRENGIFLESEKINLLSAQTPEVADVVNQAKVNGNKYLGLRPTGLTTPVPKATQTEQPLLYIILTLGLLIGIGALIIALTRFKKHYPTEVL